MADPNIIKQASFNCTDPDEEFICPYDPVHKIIAKRFPYHVMKCRKNWNGRTMLTCIFNARHIVSASEHRHHIQNCPDKAVLEQHFAYQERLREEQRGLQGGRHLKGNTALPEYSNRAPSPSEDWDSEIVEEAATNYNPSNYPGPPVYQNLAGYSTAEKRDHHKDIRPVHFKTQNDLDSYQRPFPRDGDRSGNVYQPSYNATPSNDYMYQPHAPAQQQDSGEQQLRLPKQPPKAAAVVSTAGNPKQSTPWKGGRIAANIFSAPPSDQANGASAQPTRVQPPPGLQPPPGFQPRPAMGIGRGLVPGIGRGTPVPGIGRGLVKSEWPLPGEN